jgi:hypothetical protein
MVLGFPFFYLMLLSDGFFRLFPDVQEGAILLVISGLNGVLWGVVVVSIARRLVRKLLWRSRSSAGVAREA